MTKIPKSVTLKNNDVSPFVLDASKAIKKVEPDLSYKLGDLTAPDVRLVTSLNLKRTFVTGTVKHAKIIFSDNSYREVVVAGLRQGVVWDEIIRALVDRELSSIEPFAGLGPFLPA